VGILLQAIILPQLVRGILNHKCPIEDTDEALIRTPNKWILYAHVSGLMTSFHHHLTEFRQ